MKGVTGKVSGSFKWKASVYSRGQLQANFTTLQVPLPLSLRGLRLFWPAFHWVKFTSLVLTVDLCQSHVVNAGDLTVKRFPVNYPVTVLYLHCCLQPWYLGTWILFRCKQDKCIGKSSDTRAAQHIYYYILVFCDYFAIWKNTGFFYQLT